MRWLRFALLAAILVIATVRAPPGMVASGLFPCLLLVPALFLGFTAKPGTAALAGWILGFLVDLNSLEPLGLAAFLFAAAGYSLARLRGAVFAEHPVTRAVLSTIVALFVLLVLLVRLSVAEPDFAALSRLLPMIVTAVVTGLMVPVFGALDERLGILKGFREGDRRV